MAGSPDELAPDLQVVAESTLSTCLLYCGESVLKTDDESTMMAHVARIAGELSATENGFAKEVCDDLMLLTMACNFGDVELVDRRAAFDTLRERRAQASYTGVLASFIMNHDCWTAWATVISFG